MECLPQVPENQEQHTMLCCECGTPIVPNDINMCVACVRTHVDITEGIPKQGIIYFCKACERYLQPPNQWITCSLESRELLALCLKKLKGLNRVRLVDAGFVWTEPHSRRVKVKLTIQQEIFGGAILQQEFVVEFTCNSQMCDDCHRVEAKDFWNALVQIRQKTNHKKTFYYLEQQILKNKIHLNTLNIKATHGGLDFFFSAKDHARKLVTFLISAVPCRYQTSQQLISHDVHSNTYNYKTTFSVEIVPVCKDDIVCLPANLAKSLGSIGQICVCLRVTSSIHLIDPRTRQVTEITGSMYWRTPFQTICGSKQLIEYIVMNIEPAADKAGFPGQGPLSEKHGLAELWVVKASELGTSGAEVHCLTHLGHILKEGDSVLGFDVVNSNVNDTSFDKLKPNTLPSVVIVKKIYPERKRLWMLRHIVNETDDDTYGNDKDKHEFMNDLEQDPILREQVNIFRDPNVPIDDTESNDENDPHIDLAEMLEDLVIGDDDDDEATGGAEEEAGEDEQMVE